MEITKDILRANAYSSIGRLFKEWAEMLQRRHCMGMCLAAIGVGCSSTRPIVSALPEWLAQGRFGPPSVRVDREQLFELTPAMRAFLREQVAPLQRQIGPREALFEALRAGGLFRLDYDGAVTRTAAEAFSAQRGNCLSLVLLTAALAREMGLGVSYQSIVMDEVISRGRSLLMASGHVNVSLHPPLREQGRGSSALVFTTIDFIPIDDATRTRARPLSEGQIVAMFMNNRAVELMDVGRLDDAHAMLQAALRADPASVNVFNTLAVLYRRHGDQALAEAALAWALAREPQHVPALSNWVLVLRDAGRDAEAEQVQARLRQLQPQAPLEAFERGRTALRRQEWSVALREFEREFALGTRFHELLHGLARAHHALGHRQQAAEFLEMAQQEAPSPEERQRYAHKLDVLRRAGVARVGS